MAGILYAANGSMTFSDLGKKQAQTIQDFRMTEQYVIKEEKHKSQKKTQCKYYFLILKEFKLPLFSYLI